MREVLKDNLNRLMEASRDLKTVKQLAERSKVSTGTIDRMRRAEVNVGLDHLQPLAEAFDLQPWQMLVPGLEVTNPPLLATETAKMREFYDRLRNTKEAINGLLHIDGNTSPGDLED